MPPTTCKRGHEPLQPDTCPLCRGLTPSSRRPRPVANGPCTHRGPETGGSEVLLSCQKDPPARVPLYQCAIYGTCTLAKAARDTRCCAHCSDREAFLPADDSPFTARLGDPAVGVVIGSYKFPGLVELQLRAIRHWCGPVPVLVSDDCSPHAGELARVCEREGAEFSPNPERLGHTGGDLAAFWKGIRWARSKKLQVLCKLSQRFIGTSRRWLQDGARELIESALPLSSNRCRGRESWPLRTEAVLLDAAAWHRDDVLDFLAPRQRPKPANAEFDFARLLDSKLGGLFWPWKLFGEDRYERRPGYLWHCSHRVGDYRKLAARFGVELDESFHVDGWQNDRSYVH